MDTASGSDCSSGGMEHTAVVATHRLPCLHQNSQRLATNQYEICGLVFSFDIHLSKLDHSAILALPSYLYAPLPRSQKRSRL
ncbi:MAG: hypothetical protein FJ390_02120 [Verrucomicrobia bacterium]|nr:hypothetical protein [Verrucomicrobiota bacterium]